MSTRSRYGLRTMTITAGGSHRALSRQLRSGRKSAVVRPLLDPGGHLDALEEVGQRLLLLERGGRSIAVVQVLSVSVNAFSEVTEALCRADDPDIGDLAAWRRQRRRAWAASGHLLHGDFPVVCLSVHVLGVEREESAQGPITGR